MEEKTRDKARPPVVCIIPARYGSTRLEGKMLRTIRQVPLIVWTMRRAVDSGAFDAVYVATDDKRIYDTVRDFGGEAIMTSANHRSGTDRVCEAATQLNCQYVVNLQGDEPLFPLWLLVEFSRKLTTIDTLSLLTCVSDATLVELHNPNVVKAVLSIQQQALYFSRSAIPFSRDGTPAQRYKHSGIYGFSLQALRHFCSLPQGVLERVECLEQLRALEHGMPIHCLVRQYESISIDTQEDYEALCRRLEAG
ncbi:MAG: 3-deoxy-manno-octulosonate cytidylyltransferase [Chitinivibrionales bacterium]|nr:3-deoxy-manno-octulosonate cytidylyltransferase [Chitinivibrionales bacterium]